MSDYDQESGDHVGKFPCIANEVQGKNSCESSDALSIYGHSDDNGEPYYDGYCYSCEQNFTRKDVHSSSLAGELGINDSGEVVKRIKFTKKPKAEKLTKEQLQEFHKETSISGGGYRGISDETLKFYFHRSKFDSDGNVIARYYPETKNGKVTGYKCRNHPKDFTYGKVGLTGQSCELSGQFKFKKGSKYLLIVGGEEDKCAAFQMLRDSQIARGQSDYEPIAVVSPTIGESGAYKQIKEQYDFINKFDNIIIGFDSDEAGEQAAEKVADILPKEKVKIAHWSGKDPNKMLQNHQSKQFIRDFYGAKDLVKSSIKNSGQLDLAVLEALVHPKVPLPTFMSELQSKMAGGIPTGDGSVIVNITAETGIGKTSIVNEMIYYWIFNSPVKMGVVTLELNDGQYGLAMLSRHIGKKLQLFSNGQDAVDYLNTDYCKNKRKELWNNEYGEPRWYLLDERDGSLQEAQAQCEKLHSKYGCELIVLDPLQDLLDGSTNEEQAVFMKWQKAMTKKGVTFININHTRKTGNTLRNKDGEIVLRELREDDIMGSSAIAKSGAANIFCIRDKHSEDVVEKNTTYVSASKIRWTGHSGRCGEWYYDLDTHTLHDKKTFFNDNPPNEDGGGKPSKV